MNNPRFIYSKNIGGVIIIQNDWYSDIRGSNFEGFNEEIYKECIPISFKVDSFSISKRGVGRGMHGDKQNYKLVQCLFGRVQLVLFDIRKLSDTYERAENFYLNAEVPTQILIPPNVLNGHCVLSDSAVFSYKLSNNYVSQENQLHAKLNDKRIIKQIKWNIGDMIVSERDK